MPAAAALHAASNPPVPVDARRVRADQGRLLFERTRLSNAIGPVLGGLSLLLLWPLQAHGLLLAWWLAKCGTCAWRAALDRRQRGGDDAAVRHALHRHQWPLALDGLLYSGLGGWLLPPDQASLGHLGLAAAAGIAAVGLIVLASHRASLLAFQLPLMLGAIAWQATLGTRTALFAAAGGCLLLLILVVEGWRADRLIRQSIQTRLSLTQVARQREQALALARQHAAAKTRFVGTMGHEMRTPLHAMLGIARLMQHGLQEARAGLLAGDPGAVRRATDSLLQADEQLQLLQHNGQQLLVLIGDVLDHTQIEAGRLDLADEPFDLTRLLAGWHQRTRLVALERGLDLQLRGVGTQPAWVRGDAERLRQLLQLLAAHALTFSRDGQLRLELLPGGAGSTTLALHDCGPHIPPEELAHLFDAFRLDEAEGAQRPGGASLGLALARALARRMGGELDCRSAPGAGACFTLVLPLPAVAAPPADAPLPEAPPARLQGRVLLVEDNAVNAMVAEAMLARAGLAVARAVDGAQALQCLASERFDAVLMDCQMPVLDGLSATRRIRAREQAAGGTPVPIIGLTANATAEDRQNCLDAGMDEHLPKPFREQQLHSLLARHLARG